MDCKYIHAYYWLSCYIILATIYCWLKSLLVGYWLANISQWSPGQDETWEDDTTDGHAVPVMKPGQTISSAAGPHSWTSSSSGKVEASRIVLDTYSIGVHNDMIEVIDELLQIGVLYKGDSSLTDGRDEAST